MEPIKLLESRASEATRSNTSQVFHFCTNSNNNKSWQLFILVFVLQCIIIPGHWEFNVIDWNSTKLPGL